MGYYSRISKAFKNVPHLVLDDDSKYLLISDCHRGDGTSNDNFLKNQNLYFAALRHYYALGYTYIELGDGDELWENRDIETIMEVHSNVFWLLSLFRQKNRIYLIYGNHDMVKKKKKLFPDMPVFSGIVMEDVHKKENVYLLHGHQAELFNFTFWKLARFLVRYLWKPLEHFGVMDPTNAAKNNTIKYRTETRLTHWAKKEHNIVIAGHTHRPMMGSIDSLYFNTGSCVHPRCITCIELERRCFTLVKWTVETRRDMGLYVAREVLAGPVCIDELI